MTQDLRLALRTLRRTPGFTLAAVVSLALGIGANAALFSMVDALLLRPLPVAAPSELVTVARFDRGSGKLLPVDAPLVAGLAGASTTFVAVASTSILPSGTLAIDGVAEPPRTIARVTPDFFRVLGLAPALGSLASARPALVLSNAYWRSRFGASPEALARPIAMDGELLPVVGVAPSGFFGVSLDAEVDAWVVRPEPLPGGTLLARLRTGATPERARSVAAAVAARRDEETDRAPAATRTDVEPAGRGVSSLREPYRMPLLALMGLVAIALLMTCVNVSNLIAARNARRAGEIAVRAALGAGSGRILRQLLVESLLLGAIGALGGWVVGRVGVALLVSSLPLADVPRHLRFQTDARMLAFLAAVSLGAAALFAVVPAWRASRAGSALRAMRTTGGSALGSGSFARILVTTQIALAVILLTAAGLFVRTVRNVTAFPLGFETSHLVQVELSRDAPYAPDELRGVQERLMAEVAAVPGVEGVTMFNAPAFLPIFVGMEEPGAFGGSVAPNFFDVMGIPLVRGRLFGPDDVTSDRPVAVVSERYERELLDGDALGKIVHNGPFDVEIVGVVGQARLANVRWDEAMLYRVGMRENRMMSALEVRTRVDPAAVLAPVRAAVERATPGLIVSARPMDEVIRATTLRERMVATTSRCLALLGLVLSIVGLFGTAAYTVAARTAELGLRATLGAGRWDIVREALTDAAWTAGVGLTVGAAAASIAARAAASRIEGLLFGVAADDWTVVAAATAAILSATTAACVLPAWRAASIDPLRAIRSD